MRSAAKVKPVDVMPMSYPQQLILSSASVSASDKDSKEYAEPSTCRTAPLSPSNVEEEIEVQLSSHDYDDYDCGGGGGGKIFFPEEKENYYALQITPSGEVKQICPTGKSSRSRRDFQSPFVHASASKSHLEDHAPCQSAMADDFLPIHIACLYRSSPGVIALLIKCYPEGVEQKNKWGMLPIHIICSNYSLDPPPITASKMVDDFTTKQYLNNLYSGSMEGEERWEMASAVEMLVTSYPQSVNIPSDNIEWYTPLEYAMRNLPRGHDREEITNVLKRTQENSVSGVSCDGQSLSSSLSDSKASNRSNERKAFSISNCPLLYSYITTKQWERAVDKVAKSPEEASYWVEDTDYPRLPIHLACSNAAPRDLIQALLDAYPEGCMAKEGSGSYPLHLACDNALPLETVITLLANYPKATRIKDEIGRLPLHLACASGAELSIVKVLIDAYPGSCSMKDYNGHTALTYVDYCTDDDDETDEFTTLFEQYGDRSGGSDEPEEKAGDEEDCDYRKFQEDTRR